jgi:hypothetical protein
LAALRREDCSRSATYRSAEGCDYVLMPYITFSFDSGVASMALAGGRLIIATRIGGLGVLPGEADPGLGIEEPAQ